MIYVSHRVNDICSLKNTPVEYGIEIDIRDYEYELILSHDPFIGREDFHHILRLETFLKYYKHKFIILNIKNEGIEYRVLEILKKYHIDNYFFLDCSFPMINKLSQNNENNIAMRLSEYETIETVLNMKNKVKWVWVDCFTKFPLNKDQFDLLKQNGFNICIVSPELQGQLNKLYEYKEYITTNNIIPDMICTKLDNINKWK